MNYHSTKVLLTKADNLLVAISNKNKKLQNEISDIIKCLNDMIKERESKIYLLKEILNRTKEIINEANPCINLKIMDKIANEYSVLKKYFEKTIDLKENETEMYLEEKYEFLLGLEKRYLPNFSNCKKYSDFSLITECLKNEITSNSSKIRIGFIGKCGN